MVIRFHQKMTSSNQDAVYQDFLNGLNSPDLIRPRLAVNSNFRSEEMAIVPIRQSSWSRLSVWNDAKAGCQICGREFSSLNNGKRHFRAVHSEIGTNDRQCMICFQTFDVSPVDDFDRHLRETHGVTQRQIFRAKRIKMKNDGLLLDCRHTVICLKMNDDGIVCGAKFPSVRNARRHYMITHVPASPERNNDGQDPQQNTINNDANEE